MVRYVVKTRQMIFVVKKLPGKCTRSRGWHPSDWGLAVLSRRKISALRSARLGLEEAEPCQCLISHAESAQPGLMARAEICLSESAPVATAGSTGSGWVPSFGTPAAAVAQAHHLSGQGHSPQPLLHPGGEEGHGLPLRPAHWSPSRENETPKKLGKDGWRRVTGKVEGSPERGLETGRERFSRVGKNWA